MHKAAVQLDFGLCNLVGRHKGIDNQTPAQAARVEDRRWTQEEVVKLTEGLQSRERRTGKNTD